MPAFPSVAVYSVECRRHVASLLSALLLSAVEPARASGGVGRLAADGGATDLAGGASGIARRVVTEAPYAQYDRRLQQYSGANVELMGWLATAMQVTLRWQGYPDQAALDDALRAGRVDIAPGLSQTPAGLRLWLFSDPYLRVSRLVVGKRDGSGSVELEQLERDTRVAVRAGSSVADYLSSTYSGLQWGRPIPNARCCAPCSPDRHATR